MSDYIRFWLKEHKIKTSNKKIHQKNPKTQQQEKNPQKVLQKSKNQTHSQSQVQSAQVNSTGWSFDVNCACNSQG